MKPQKLCFLAFVLLFCICGCSNSVSEEESMSGTDATEDVSVSIEANDASPLLRVFLRI